LSSHLSGLEAASSALHDTNDAFTIESVCVYKRILQVKPEFVSMVKELHSAPLSQITYTQ